LASLSEPADPGDWLDWFDAAVPGNALSGPGARGFLTPQEARTIAGLIAATRAGDGILDLGCGGGRRLRVWAESAHGRCFTGIDKTRHTGWSAPSPAAIAWVEADAASLPVGAATQALVIALEVLHLVAAQAAALAEIRRVMAPGASLVLSLHASSTDVSALEGVRSALTGFELDITDTSATFGAYMERKHMRRLKHAALLREKMGDNLAGVALSVSHQIAGPGREMAQARRRYFVLAR
jgi:SAM-dependent methyltransferase